MEKENSLKPIWDSIVSIYSEFATICEKFGLRYYVSDGSAIGAVRHNGFIPWDDDLDVSMPREDYDRFMSEAHKYLPNHLVAFDRRWMPELGVIFGKIQETREEVVHAIERQVGFKLSNGLYIDIFPIDGYPKSVLKRVLYRIKFFTILAVKRYRGDPFKDYTFAGKLAWVLGWLATKISPSCRQMSDFAAEKDKLGRSVPFSDDEFTVRIPSVTEKLLVYGPKVWGHGILHRFENIKVKLPDNYDACLKAQYGDYMTLPPEEERHSTHLSDSYRPWWLGPTTGQE